MALRIRPHRTAAFIMLVICFIISPSHAAYQWLLDQSDVFSDAAQEVSICFGDVNNDGSADMVIGKHLDHGNGRTAAFQQTAGTWDAGTQIYAGGNGNVQPLVGHINGSNRLVINKHDQGIYSGYLQFLKFDSDFNLDSSYSISLNSPCFSDQVLIGETVYFNNRYNLAKAEWHDLNSTFTATQLANNGDCHTHYTTIAADDLTGDGVKEIIYVTYDGARGLNVLVNDTQVQIDHGYALMFTSGQFDPNTAVHEIFYASNGLDSLSIVRYNPATQMFIPQEVLSQQEQNISTAAAFDINGDGVDEALLADLNGEIFQFDLVTRQFKTVITSDVDWYDSTVADWGDGERAVFVGSQNGKVTVIAFGGDVAVMDDMNDNKYPQGTPIDVRWTFNGLSTLVDVQVRAVGTETWTTMTTVGALSGYCELSGLIENAYDLRLADAADNGIVYGQTGTFNVYTCTQTLAGDLDGDCYVDLIDFDLLSAGYVDFNDFLTFVEDWLQCTNPYDDVCN